MSKILSLRENAVTVLDAARDSWDSVGLVKGGISRADVIVVLFEFWNDGERLFELAEQVLELARTADPHCELALPTRRFIHECKPPTPVRPSIDYVRAVLSGDTSRGRGRPARNELERLERRNLSRKLFNEKRQKDREDLRRRNFE